MEEILMNILVYVGIALLGYLSIYFKKSTQIKSLIVEKIAEAEAFYKDTTEVGGVKFAYVVDFIYGVVPTILRPIITRAWIESAVQTTFDMIEDYATTLLDEKLPKPKAKAIKSK